MKDKRVVFMGTPEFSVPVLEMLIENTNVVMVVTQPDSYVGRKHELNFSPVKEVALKYNIPVFQPQKIRNDYESVLACNPDIIIMPSVIQNVIKDRYTLNVIKSKDDFINKKNVLNVFPFDRFSPIDSTGKRYVLKTSNHTYSIHHFASAWVDPKVMLLVKIFGDNSKTRLLIQRISKWIRDKIMRRIKF